MSSPSSPSAPGPDGLTLEAVEWLPSSGGAGLLRVRGRWAGARTPDALPELVLGDERFVSLPDSRGEPGWRAAYVLPAAPSDDAEPWLEWEDGARAPLSLPAAGEAPVPAAAGEPAGGQVIDRAVLAERRTRRAEAAEQAQARIAGEALKAVEVLEARSAELERRVAELGEERAALAARLAGAPAAPAASAAPAVDDDAAERARLRAERHREALTAALAEAARLRELAREWRLKLRTSEVSRTADAVRLSVLEAEHAALVPEAAAARAEAAERADELDAERARSAQLSAALAEAQAAAATASAALAEARAAGAAAERTVAERDAELASTTERLSEVRAELDAARAAAAELERRAGELERALDAERRLAETARADLDDARTASAATAARTRVESVARAALDFELQRERSAREALSLALDAERERAAGAERARAAAVADAARLSAELTRARDAALLARAELADERTLRRRAEAELAAGRAAAAREGTSLHDRIAALDQRAAGLADELRLQRAARAQAEAAAARTPVPQEAAGRVVADLDAAATALRERAEPAPGRSTSVEPGATAPSGGPDEDTGPAPPSPPAPPPIEVPAGAPPRAAPTGSSAHGYPWLRGALVKLAHDDPATAGRLLLALLPAQSAYLSEPLDYDLTITGTGTFAVSVTGARTYVTRRSAPRGRREADFHLSADPLTLAELLAGVGPRVRRFTGPARLRGRRRRLAALERIPAAAGTLADAARAGARLEPGLVFGALPYAIHPSWTRGHRFTVAQEIAGDATQTRYVVVADGTVTAAAQAPPAGVDATVTMTPRGFEHLLRGESPPPGHRPVVRGDRLAVAQLKAWTDRAQAHRRHLGDRW